jgi:ubiquinone/menaquinone biosynthesis C-methylase UbiE
LRTTGVDPSQLYVEIASKRYSGITFIAAAMEETGLASESFDVVTLTDVLEHVVDERRTLDEIYRVLRPGGQLIVTVPHKGWFGFLDIDNLVYLFAGAFPALHRYLRRTRMERIGDEKPGYGDWHRHYSLSDVRALLDNSRFAQAYTIEEVRYAGLFIEPAAAVLYNAVRVLAGARNANQFLRWTEGLTSSDYFRSYGTASYNLALRVTKH